MKGTPTKQLLPAVLLLFLSICSIRKAQHLNASTKSIAELLSHDEEFMMESETTRRLLAVPRRTISYPVLRNPNMPVSGCAKYGSCIPRSGVPYKERKCDYANGCGRPGH